MSEEKPIIDRVTDIIMDCLYQPEEIIDRQPPADAIIVEGINARFGFHPQRLAAHKQQIIDILKLMPPQFFTDQGGGWSFLSLCMTEKGEQWGEHRDCEALMVLALASGLGFYTMPRDQWENFPGGMPYVTFFSLPDEERKLTQDQELFRDRARHERIACNPATLATKGIL